MPDRVEGYLEVGLNEAGNEVVINHPDLKPDENGVGHIVFSADQARNLARLLMEKAREIDGHTAVMVEPPDHEYFVAFYTKDCPAGKLDCVRVRLDMVRRGKEDTFDIGLRDAPLFPELQQYVKENS